MIVNNITIMSSDKSQTNLQSVRMLYRALWSLPLTDYYSDDQIKKNGIGGTRSTYNGEQSAYGRLVVKLMGTSPLVRLRLRLESNITTDLEEMGLGHGLDWCGLGKEQVAGYCECINLLAPEFGI